MMSTNQILVELQRLSQGGKTTSLFRGTCLNTNPRHYKYYRHVAISDEKGSPVDEENLVLAVPHPVRSVTIPRKEPETARDLCVRVLRRYGHVLVAQLEAWVFLRNPIGVPAIGGFSAVVERRIGKEIVGLHVPELIVVVRVSKFDSAIESVHEEVHLRAAYTDFGGRV